MNLHKRLLWLKRFFLYAVSYYLAEKPRGLDFSKRSKRNNSYSMSTGYALTSYRALRNILYEIPYDSNSSFLDVGGGKGGTCVSAIKLGFGNACSIEVEQYLHDIATKNIDILNLQQRIKLVNIDAFEYTDYGRYSHIFMFNLLKDRGHEQLLHHIVTCLGKSKPAQLKTFYLSIYGEIDIDMLLSGLSVPPNSNISIDQIRDDICPFRGNNIRVFLVNVK